MVRWRERGLPVNMRTRHLSGYAIALVSWSGCSSADEPPERVPSEGSASPIAGDWRYAYITAGTSASYGRLVFQSEGRLQLDHRSWGPTPDEILLTCADGTHTLTAENTVRYGWTVGSARVEREHAAALIERSVFGETNGWSYYENAQRYWALRGYVARDASLTRFSSTAIETAIDAGVQVPHRSTRVHLAFSSPPWRLLPDDGCTVQVEIAVVSIVDGELASREASFSLGCSVRKRDARLTEIAVAGFPAESALAWSNHLEAEGYQDAWPEALYGELVASFRPPLNFDAERPDVIFPSALDFNSPSPLVYTQVAPGTPSEWWSACSPP